MQWIRLLEVATRDLDADAPRIRRMLDELGGAARCERDGYRLDAEAQLAMGWWFFGVYVREDFVRDVVRHMHARDERALLDHVQRRLKEQGSKATVKFHSKPSIFARYWTWLMR